MIAKLWLFLFFFFEVYLLEEEYMPSSSLLVFIRFSPDFSRLVISFKISAYYYYGDNF